MNAEHFEEFLDFKCPYCGAVNSFPASATGAVRECVNCLNAFLAPKAGEEEATKVPFPIETPKLRLRPFEPADWKYWKQLNCETEEQLAQWIKEQSVGRLASAQRTYLAIEDKEAEELVGWIGMQFMDFALNQIEIALSVNRAAKDRGLDAEAVTAAIELCFQDFRVHRVYAQCFAHDEYLARLLPAVGMKQEAEFRKNFWDGNEWRSTCWFAMLEEEFSRQ